MCINVAQIYGLVYQTGGKDVAFTQTAFRVIRHPFDRFSFSYGEIQICIVRSKDLIWTLAMWLLLILLGAFG